MFSNKLIRIKHFATSKKLEGRRSQKISKDPYSDEKHSARLKSKGILYQQNLLMSFAQS